MESEVSRLLHLVPLLVGTKDCWLLNTSDSGSVELAVGSEISCSQILFDLSSVEVDDLTSNLLVWSKVALAGVRAQVYESSLACGRLWFGLLLDILSHNLSSVYIGANRVALSCLLFW